MRISDCSSDVCSSDRTCGALDGEAERSYWLAEAVQHDYGTVRPDGFDRYRAGDWPAGEVGEAYFCAMADPGTGLPHARIASGDSFIACPDVAAGLVRGLGATLVAMEVAAVAQAALRLGQPWAASKAVTDTEDAGSRREFPAKTLPAHRPAGSGRET